MSAMQAEAEGGGTGSARRRRERRLRANLRYARMSVAMALAECQHHSAQRPKKASTREEEREVHYTAAFRTTVPPPEPELFNLCEEPGGRRPDPLLEPACCWSAGASAGGPAARREASCGPCPPCCKFSMFLYAAEG